MAITRVTQTMMSRHSLDSMQTGLSRLARIQEQLSTGRILNRPSDAPADAAAAMRLRGAMADQAQYGKNAADGLAWLAQVDTALTSATDQVRRVRELALQGASSGSMSDQGREALATEIDQLKQSLLTTANTGYLGRPVFGGITAGSAAYDATGAYVGVDQPVTRTVGDGVKVRIDVSGPAVFASSGTSVFDDLTALSTALRANDVPGIRAGVTAMDGHLDAITSMQADAGTRMKRLQQADTAAGDADLTLRSRLSELENTDLPKAMVDLKLQEVAYQAALASTARVMQPSLVDFLR
jgi:flagellar hook-associated protein 3 FlgL